MRPRAAAALVLLIAVGWLGAVVTSTVTVDQALDSDGQLVRAANHLGALRTGHPAFAEGVGMPTWGTPLATSPYPPGYPALAVPALALAGGNPLALRLGAVGLGLLTLLAAAALAHRLAGPAAAVTTAAVLAASAPFAGYTPSATICTLVGLVVTLAATALAKGLRAPGAGLRAGLALMVALNVKWTAAALLLPAVGATALDVARGSPRARAAVIRLAAAGALTALGLGLGLAAGAGSWMVAGLLLPVGHAALEARRAAAAGEERVARLAGAAALAIGPGLAWYAASLPTLAAYAAANGAAATPPESPLAAGAGFVAAQFPAALALGLAGLVFAPPGLGRALAATGLAAYGGLALTGDPAIFRDGAIAGRLFLEPLPLLAVGAGLGVAGVGGARAAVVAGLLALVGLTTSLASLAAPCPVRPGDRAVVRTCTPLRWARVPSGDAGRPALDRLLPPAPALRITVVLVPDRRRVVADEALYLRGLFDGNRAFTVVEATPAAVAGWLDRPDVHEVVGLGLPAPAGAARLGTVPGWTTAWHHAGDRPVTSGP